MANNDGSRRLGGKLIYVLSAVVVLVLVGLAGVIYYVFLTPKPQEQSKPKLTGYALQSEQIRVSNNVREDADKALQNGDLNKFNDIYTAAIKNESDPTMKVKLALDQGLALVNYGKMDDAEKFLKLALDYSDDKFLVADSLGRFYSVAKKYKLAEEYFRLAAKFADSKTNETGYDAAYYNERAERAASMGAK